MKKKALFFTLIIFISVGWFVYRAMHVSTQVVVETDNDNTKVISLETNVPLSLKMNASVPDDDKTSKTTKASGDKKNYRLRETKDDQFLAFDKLENEWLLKAREIIGDNYAQYLEMRNQNEKEKLQAYKEYHDYLRQKYGDKFSYNITDDQSTREKKINQRYLNELLKLIGAEKFTNYTAAKDQFNEEMRRKNKESIQIEF